jgi:hypothetical protein
MSLWRGVPQEGMDHTIDDDGISSTANILSERKHNSIKQIKKSHNVANKET